MSTFHHPAFPHILHRCDDADGADAIAKGWVPLLDKKQKRRLTQITREVESRAVVEQLESDIAPRK